MKLFKNICKLIVETLDEKMKAKSIKKGHSSIIWRKMSNGIKIFKKKVINYKRSKKIISKKLKKRNYLMSKK